MAVIWSVDCRLETTATQKCLRRLALVWSVGCRLGTDAVANLRAASNSKPEVLDWSIQVGPQGGILHALLMYQGVLFRGALPNQLP